ncbi:unnamed protein product [Penicillium salamii]|uniref:Major facilitator superfamily (MFS) profile domain-containing protein n=1 Tax=Penicillium salamii TaxID=1612424 RepID=A0A9W4JWU7_9EURO|nr:unnamed protein product [Penicillium salamii]CAG8334119.1 unnamed protein product [Penicillium salamii]CAG8360266.1 unnamed protein product [Penicillium salamii]CAG8371603.1 unnamed protein product [Penicillium salamii]CAG8386532.1 unnamed protein product [Penicillium salamii]
MSVSKTGKAKIALAEDSGERSPAEADVSSSEGHISFGDIIEGTATHQATPFERKAALVNAEIDKFGFGKYQQCIWVLCGFGYFLDLAWTQGVGLMVTAVFQEMDVPPSRQGLIFSCSNAGLAIGAFSFGILTDIIGRKWAFNLTCLITSVFGILLAAVKYNYAAICGIYFLSSVGLGGNIPIDAAIALEFLPQNRRFLVALLGIWQPIGVVVASAISYGTAAKYRCDVKLPACNAAGVSPGESCCSVSSNMGWRYEVIAIGMITFVVFFVRCLIFRFHESPKFLISKGRDQDAIDVLRKIAKFNKAPAPTLTIEDFQRINSDTGSESGSIKSKSPKNVALGFFKIFKHLRGLFACKAECFSFTLLAVAYMGDYWSFTLAGSFLPIILLRNNVESGGNVTETYLQYIYIYLPGIIGAVIALFSIQLPLIGRKWSLVIAATLQGVSMALYTQVKNTAGYVGLNALEYIMQTYFNAVLYASAPEMFNTTYRTSASGMLSCLGRIAGIVAPFAGQRYIEGGSAGVLWLGAGGIWVSALFLTLLPIEMNNRQMY